MNPTKEQIEEVLAAADRMAKIPYFAETSGLVALAAAYRALEAEVMRLQRALGNCAETSAAHYAAYQSEKERADALAVEHTTPILCAVNRLADSKADWQARAELAERHLSEVLCFCDTGVLDCADSDTMEYYDEMHARHEAERKELAK